MSDTRRTSPEREEWVTKLQDRLLPDLSLLVARIGEKYPDVRAKTFSVSVGAATGFDGHSIGIECLLPNVPSNEPDLIAISLQFGHLSEKPTLLDADVCWGHPRSHCELSLFEEPVPLNDATLSSLAGRLPELERQLTVALDRRRPPR
jgi:hypothetical protein